MTHRSHSDKLWPDLLLAGMGLSAMMLFVGLVFGGRGVVTSHERAAIGHLSEKTSSVRRRFSDSLVWRELPSNSAVYEGDVVFVSQDSAATIELVDGSRTEVGESTLLILKLAKRLDDASTSGPVVVEIVHGRAVGNAGDREMAVQTGESITTLEKGASVTFRARRQGSTQIDVTRGHATLRSGQSPAAQIATNERRIIGAHGALKSSQNLAIQLQHPGSDHEQISVGTRQEVAFDWVSAGTGWTYRVELSRDVHFDDIVVRAEIQKASSLQLSLSSGIYYWRVRGTRDAEILESEERRLVLLQKVPPVGYEPSNGTEIYVAPGTPLSLAWLGAPGVDGYSLQLARGTNFDELLLEQDVIGRSFFQTRQIMTEGLYCYRIRNREPMKIDPPWSSVTCFDLITQPRLRAPTRFESRLDTGSEYGLMGDVL